MNLRDGRVRFLASVTSAAEARICVAGGADIIDAKDPARGALGALDIDTVRAIRAAVPASIPVSATIGDLPSEPEPVARAVEATAATGVDYVKIGFFPEGDAAGTIARLAAAEIGRARLVGVLFADLAPDFSLIAQMSRAGFAGVLIDTANKSSPPLPDLISRDAMTRFVGLVRDDGLFAGLAGSLRLAHIPALLDLRPNILGFRGALCGKGVRTGEIDPRAVATVRSDLDSIEARAGDTAPCHARAAHDSLRS